MTLRILYEDNHLLAVDKPAGLLVQGDRSGEPTLLEEARLYLKEKYAKPGNVYVGLVHRLDRNVSGVVLLARTSKAAARLSAQFRQGLTTKTYLAVVGGTLPAASGTAGKIGTSGTLRAWLAPAGDDHGVTAAALEAWPGAKESLLHYEVVDRTTGWTLVRVHPVTGRRHQIRAQFALVGCPLLGDVKYGCPRTLPDHRIALHALRLEISHPVGARPLNLACDPPVDWPWPMGDALPRP